MGVLDRLFGDSGETESTQVGTETEGGTRSRTGTTTDTGTTKVGKIGSQITGGTSAQEGRKESTGQVTKGGTATQNQQQQNRGQTTDYTSDTGREDRTGSRVGQEQQSGNLERLLAEFSQRQETGKESGTQVGTNVVDSLAQTGTVVENLDEASRDALANLLQQFSGEGGALNNFVGILQDRVGASQQRIASQNANILAAAERQGTRDIGASRTRLAAAAGGSTRNSLVEASAAELENDLRTNLAGLEAQLDQQARAEEREEIEQVLRGFGTQGTVAQQVGSTLAQGRQVAQENRFAQETGHQTLESLVESLTSSQDTSQTRENALNTLSSLSQEQLLDTIQQARQTDRRGTTDNVLFGETTQQEQSVEAQFLSELSNMLSQNEQRSVTDEEIMEVVDRISTDTSDEAFLTERAAVADTTSKNKDDFNFKDVIGFVSDLGRQ